MDEWIRITVASDADILRVRQAARALAQHLGFTAGDQTLIVAVVSELARNIVQYAGTGEIVVQTQDGDQRTGIGVVAEDAGPGIPDLARVLRGGYSTSGGLGLGLSGAKRVMDEFKILSEVGKGTTVRATKWCPTRLARES